MLLLERGRNVEHVKDYVNATKQPWEFAHRALARTNRHGRALPRAQARLPAQREEPVASGSTSRESPYTEVRRFDWIRGRQVGGRSITWGRQVYRWSDLDFEANLGMAMVWTGRSAMPTSRRGTIMWSATSG